MWATTVAPVTSNSCGIIRPSSTRSLPNDGVTDLSRPSGNADDTAVVPPVLRPPAGSRAKESGRAPRECAPGKFNQGTFMVKKLDGKKVAILVADGFEQVEMTEPREALDEAGAETRIVSIKSGKVQGVNHDEKGDKFDVDFTLDAARAGDFDALLIPGGLMNPDAMRQEESALEFVRHFFETGKPVAVICHG